MRADILHQLLADREAKRPVVLASDLETGEGELIYPGENGADGGLREAAEAAARADKSRVVEHEGRRLFLNVHNPPLRLIIVGAVHIRAALVADCRARRLRRDGGRSPGSLRHLGALSRHGADARVAGRRDARAGAGSENGGGDPDPRSEVGRPGAFSWCSARRPSMSAASAPPGHMPNVRSGWPRKAWARPRWRASTAPSASTSAPSRRPRSPSRF